MSSSGTVKELSRRLYACTAADGSVKNVNAVLEIMKSLETTKITVNDLQETRLGRHVNLIRKKTSDPMLMKRSRKLIKLWQKVAETKPAAGTSSATVASTSLDDAASSRLAGTPLRKQMLMTPGGTPAASSTPRPRNNMQQTPKISKKQAPSQHHLQTPLNHRLNGHSSTTSTKRKNNTTDVATPSAKRARSTVSNNTPVPSASSKRSGVGSSSWRKSQMTSSLPEDDGEKFASSLQGTKLLISIKKQKPTTSTLTAPTTTKNNHNQQKQTQQHSRKQLVYDNSPQSLDSLDSDRTMDNTSPPVDVTKSKEPSSGVGGPPPVYFDVKTDPYFCSSLTPTPQQISELKEGERHGENGCLGDNGRFYRWEEDCIVMKHRYLPTKDDPNDEGLLLIMPYVELE